MHQFIAVWMNIGDVTLENEPDDTPKPGGSDGISKGKVIDGDNPAMAGKQGYDLRVTVDGWFPLGDKYKGDTITLPRDWAKLASLLAVDGTNKLYPGPGEGTYRWDIHDDKASSFIKDKDGVIIGKKGHWDTGRYGDPPCTVYGCVDISWNAHDACDPDADGNYNIRVENNVGIDSVDNCLGGQKQFSTIWDGMTKRKTLGPFDPVRPWSTLLSNGVLDADDAPMPAARIDFKILPNENLKGVKKDINGVGYFGKVDKRDVYSQDYDGDGNCVAEPVMGYDLYGNDYGGYECDRTYGPHELYAPFYKVWFPPVGEADVATSGIVGDDTNNFAGFLEEGKYRFWYFAKKWQDDPNRGGDTECLKHVGIGDGAGTWRW